MLDDMQEVVKLLSNCLLKFSLKTKSISLINWHLKAEIMEIRVSFQY